MYCWNPQDYAQHSSGQEKWARELLGQLQLRDDDRVLDVGCGDGRITAEIAAAVPGGCAVGVDLSAEFIRYAAQRFPPADHPNLSFIQADMSHLDFDRQFSVVFSNAAMHWVKDHRPILAGIARALVPGGRCLLQMGGGENGAEVIAAVEACAAQPRWRAYFEGFESTYGFHHPLPYRTWLRDAGLAPTQVELIEKDMVHEDREAFCGWVRTAWHPYTSRVPADQRDEFIAEVADRYLSVRPVDEGGRVHVRMVRLQVAATRP